MASSLLRGQTYTAVGLGSGTTANAINNAGTVVGQVSLSNGKIHAFKEDLNGALIDLGTLNGTNANSAANAINNSGAIVGYSDTSYQLLGSPVHHAFEYSSGGMVDLGVGNNSTDQSEAWGINSFGEVVGTDLTADPTTPSAFTYTGGALDTIAALGILGNAFGVNDAGVIVGDYNDPSQPYSYANGAVTNLDAAAGAAGIAVAINNAGVIVGYTADMNNADHGYVWANGLLSALPNLPGGGTSEAHAINSQNVVVGQASYADTQGSGEHAFIYRDGVISDLNSLVTLQGVKLVNASGINDQGQIIVEGDNAVAYLLTPVVSMPGTARLINISTRAQVGTGASILISGFVVSGSGTETLLIRADGPSLATFGVVGLLAQPSMSVFDNTGKVLATNTAWSTGPDPGSVSAAAASAGAFPIPSGSADSALVLSLPAGAYTVQVSGVGGTTGVALAEIYEVATTGTRLINISTRTGVGTGAGILISGFVISGTGTEQVLGRADGPSLSAFGVTGVLAQPSLTLFDSSGASIDSNTGWGNSPNPALIATTAAAVGAFPLSAGSADSAHLGTLPAGAYTIQISGVNNTTGVALAEVYEVHN